MNEEIKHGHIYPKKKVVVEVLNVAMSTRPKSNGTNSATFNVSVVCISVEQVLPGNY